MHRTPRFHHFMHLSMSSSGGGGRGSGIGWGFWHSLNKIIKIPTPGQRIIVKISRNKCLLLIYSLKLTDQMHDGRSKSPPWGYASRSNSRGLPDPPPPPLGLDIDRCISVVWRDKTECEYKSIYTAQFIQINIKSRLCLRQQSQQTQALFAGADMCHKYSVARLFFVLENPGGRQIAWNDADSFVSLQMKICKQFQWSVKRPFITS